MTLIAQKRRLLSSLGIRVGFAIEIDPNLLFGTCVCVCVFGLKTKLRSNVRLTQVVVELRAKPSYPESFKILNGFYGYL